MLWHANSYWPRAPVEGLQCHQTSQLGPKPEHFPSLYILVYPLSPVGVSAKWHMNSCAWSPWHYKNLYEAEMVSTEVETDSGYKIKVSGFFLCMRTWKLTFNFFSYLGHPRWWWLHCMSCYRLWKGTMCSSSIARHCDVQQNDLYYKRTFQVTVRGKTGWLVFHFAWFKLFPIHWSAAPSKLLTMKSNQTDLLQ